MGNDTPKLLPIGPMARRLRVSVGWLRHEADAGNIPALKAGDRFLFDPESVERALIERARQMPAKPQETGEVGRG